MTDRTQFEAMLEALINEDQETAKEIFHNIVVAKSREIYEELLAEDFDFSEEGEEEETAVEAFGDDEEGGEEEAAPEEGDGEEGEGDDEFGGDMGDEEGEDLSDEEQTDRILDLEDALEELKAEFEQMMAGEEGEEHMGSDEFGGDMGGDEFGGADLEVDEEEFAAPVMEYVNKVSLPKHGDNGVQTKSVVAGKNDMGGTTANIAKGGTEKGPVEANKGQLKGNGVFKGSKPALQDGGNVNVPGGKSGTKLKPVAKGHGAEKKGASEQAPNKKSIIGSRG